MRKDNPGAAEPSSPRLLTSWKEIAALLGISVRTAQIYEKTRGLPVQRDGKRVAALESELLEWRFRRLTELPWWSNVIILQRIAATLAALLLVGLSVLLWQVWSRWRPRTPVSAHWAGNTITAVDAAGAAVWTHEFPYPIMEAADSKLRLLAWVGDIDNDGNKEVVAAYPHVRRESDGWDLYSFSARGEIRWRLSIEKEVRTDSRPFSPPYVLRQYTVFPSPQKDGTMWTAAVFVHHTLSPSVLVVVDAAGRRRGEYWQMGHMNVIQATDLDGDGVSELVVGGVRQDGAQAVLLVFDPRNVHGAQASPSQPGLYQLRNLPPGTEKAVVYLPRTLLNRQHEPFNFVDGLDLVRGRLQVSVTETLGGQVGYLIYNLTPALEPVDVAPSASLEAAAARQQASGGFARDLTPEGLNALAKQVRVDRR